MRIQETRVAEAYSSRFGEPPTVVASAPGRVNLIGEHTDYNGGFVFPCAIPLRVAVAAGEGPGNLYSLDYGEERTPTGCAGGSWADYPLGVAWALAEAGFSIPRFQATIHGDVPRGGGLSSSAAIEAATALALTALADMNVERQQLALLCQRAENGYLGVNSGVMDQYASLLCREGEALLIDCRSLEARGVPLDLAAAGLVLMVCDTGVERELGNTAYNDRRTACERAAVKLGVATLRDATDDDLARLDGEDLKRARHVVTENARVLAAVEALERGNLDEFGSLMYASHRSLRDDYEVSVPQLDTFVTAAEECHALGARLTGAGFGGCAIAVATPNVADAIEIATVKRYIQHKWKEPSFYRFLPAAGAEMVT